MTEQFPPKFIIGDAAAAFHTAAAITMGRMKAALTDAAMANAEAEHIRISKWNEWARKRRANQVSKRKPKKVRRIKLP